MSLLLLSRLLNLSQSSGQGLSASWLDDEGDELKRLKKSRLWLFTYISLFTSLLAFFIIIITQIELEGSTAKRNYQKMVTVLYQQVSYQAKSQGLSWLKVENTLTKGIRLTLDKETIPHIPLFNSARAKLNPRYLPYLRSVSELIQSLALTSFKKKHQKLVRGIEAAGFEVKLMIRIEGHTDSMPLAATARFRDNVELSTFRAYAMMEILRLYTGLPKSVFSMAGYGSFHPLVEDPQAPENRRVEIYIVPKIVERKPLAEEAKM
ncbi:MAG: OmpA family protein [Gammaproteobacteria bacterium]|nr:OmpA family protein [Gammaproteobacteria bacterium]